MADGKPDWNESGVCKSDRAIVADSVKILVIRCCDVAMLEMLLCAD